MKYTRLYQPYYLDISHVKLIDIYKSEEGKNNYYGTLKYGPENYEKIDKLNEYLKRFNPKSGEELTEIGKDCILKVKFTTHYGKPRYKAIGLNGLPTVAEVLQEQLLEGVEMFVNVVIKIDGYVQYEEGIHVVATKEDIKFSSNYTYNDFQTKLIEISGSQTRSRNTMYVVIKK